jgi:hypothetical protein
MSSLQPAISSTSLTAAANVTTSSVNVSSTANNRGTLTYNWQSSGTTCTINTITSVATTFTGSTTSAGSTIVYCSIKDSVTGVTTSSPQCVITWTAVPTQNVVISGTVTYTGSAQAYTLTGTPASPAPTGTPSTFISAGTYVYPTNITSITPGSGYTLGAVTGSFVINAATITAMTFSLNTIAFTSQQYRSAGPSYTIAVSSTTPSAATNSPVTTTNSTAANYTLTSIGTGNYQGSFTSPILSLISASITQNSPRTTTVVPLSAVLSQTPPGVTYAWLKTAGTSCSFSAFTAANTNCTGSGNLTSTVQCTVAYTGSTTTPSTNLVPTSVVQWGFA